MLIEAGMFSAIIDSPLTRLIFNIIIAAIIIPVFLGFFVSEAQFSWANINNTPIGTAMSWFFSTLWKWSFVLPVEAMLTAFSIYFVMEMSFIGIKIFLFLKNTIWQ